MITCQRKKVFCFLVETCRRIQINTDSRRVDRYLCHIGIKRIGRTVGSLWILRHPDKQGLWGCEQEDTEELTK